MKKLITILCALALIVGAISMVATAENYVIKIGDQGYTTLEAAVADADKGVLELQVDLDALVEIPENVVLNVDLNGKTVKSVSSLHTARSSNDSPFVFFYNTGGM